MERDAVRALGDAPLLRLLAIAGHVTGQRWERITSQQHGLTSAGVNVLLALARGAAGGGTGDERRPGRATHRELARRCWIRPATLTGVVDTLERGGLVERVRDDNDRRQVWIILTRAGGERVRRIGQQLHEAFPPTAAEQDPATAAAIRAYLIELIMTNGSPADVNPRAAGSSRA